MRKSERPGAEPSQRPVATAASSLPRVAGELQASRSEVAAAAASGAAWEAAVCEALEEIRFLASGQAFDRSPPAQAPGSLAAAAAAAVAKGRGSVTMVSGPQLCAGPRATWRPRGNVAGAGPAGLAGPLSARCSLAAARGKHKEMVAAAERTAKFNDGLLQRLDTLRVEGRLDARPFGG